MSFPNGTPDRFRANPGDLNWMRGYIIDVTDANGVTHTIEAHKVHGEGSNLAIHGMPCGPDTGEIVHGAEPVVIPLSSVTLIEVP